MRPGQKKELAYFRDSGSCHVVPSAKLSFLDDWKSQERPVGGEAGEAVRS